MKGTLSSFVRSTPKKPKYEVSAERSRHPTYPFPVPELPASFAKQLDYSPAEEGKAMKGNDLDIIYYQPYIRTSIADGMFDFFRQELFFYRVQYKIHRGGISRDISTPRFTTVFGVDDTSRFSDTRELVDAKTGRKIENSRYKCTPLPLPQCLDILRRVTEATTGETFNFALVNYYADGNDSITYHSDDERFLGPNPVIASFTFGARRDFYMKHKEKNVPQVKLQLGSGDMLLMKGTTQSKWLHSVPKRAGAEAARGRINITFRKAMVRGGTENYYQYNVGTGGVYRWDDSAKRMVPWSQGGEEPGPKAETLA
ncbi:DNA repair family protein [Westerdykella ornata]|uniref:DNA repair family protein n=1 Tax=Westerdykella ornata TaxID=318751 RepID=A0A6A6JRC9_WESOR|nr:DNA repair family protein [Westerdykella ornata]KAF2278276.1 DNA repair family protein [Westerdykella ornata]